MASSKDRSLGMLCHLLALIGMFVGIMFGSIIFPLILWLIKKDDSAFVNFHGKEAINFNISVFLYALVAAVLTLVIIGFALLPAIFIFWLVCTIIAIVKSSNGERWRYPLTLRLIN